MRPGIFFCMCLVVVSFDGAFGDLGVLGLCSAYMCQASGGVVLLRDRM